MFFRQLLDPDLGCAAYVLGDAGRAVVVDPGLDVDRIRAVAAEEGATIELVLETHTHADHVSGRAQLRVPARVPVAGEVVDVGGVRIEALAAPGHRPEHVALLVCDRDRGDGPCLVLTGDSILVGDLARPDLAVDPREGAEALHDTVARLLALGDELELWPGHIGGSLCGGGRLSRRPSSTLGYERRAQALLVERDKAAFAKALTLDLPTRPPTVEAVVARNRSADPAGPAPVWLDELPAGAVLVDARPAEAFDEAHVPGSLNVPLAGSGLGTRAAFLLGPDADVVVAGDPDGELTRRLRAVGLRVVGRLNDASHAIAATASVPALDPGDLEGRTVLDVRNPSEWEAAHLPGSVLVPLSELRGANGSVPREPLAVVCAAGARATAAASFLRSIGHDARRVTAGVKELQLSR